MDLQHQQLQQLTDWLDVTEARIKRMGEQPLGPDLEDVKHQVEEHKVRCLLLGRAGAGVEHLSFHQEVRLWRNEL